jgi:hypothetical protein
MNALISKDSDLERARLASSRSHPLYLYSRLEAQTFGEYAEKRFRLSEDEWEEESRNTDLLF